jgi:hypothetical protein
MLHRHFLDEVGLLLLTTAEVNVFLCGVSGEVAVVD